MESGDLTLHPPAPAPLPSTGPPVPSGAPADNPFGEPSNRNAPGQGLRKRIGSAFAAIAALVAKFFAAIKGALLFLPKLKLLTTAGTAVVSVAAYSLFFGWPLAAGFVVLLFVHEMGHVLQLRREGIKASAPMFIPFLGAVVAMKEMPDDALAEARVGLAGPILGSLGAALVAIAGGLLNSPLLLALAYIAFFINLINLLPVVPLDGGRAMAAMAPALWFVGFGALVALELWRPNPVLLIIIIFGGLETYRRWKQRKSGSIEQAAYYRVAPRHRLLVGVVYIGLIVGIVLGMDASFVHYAGGHDFRHYF
jgi:Zn-dependent protease